MEQGLKLKGDMYQDNRIDAILETKGHSLLGKSSLTSSIRYFSIKDLVDGSEIYILHFPTKYMVGDLFTKLLQGYRLLNSKILFGGGG